MPKIDRSLLAGLPMFSEFSADQLESVLEKANSALYRKDAAVFEQEEVAKSFFLLLSGHVRVVRNSPDGHQIIARYIDAGELFGIAIAMGRDTYPASAIAAVDCVVVRWPNSAWQELLAVNPAFGASAYQTIGSRLQDAQARVMEMSTEQVEQRIAHALLRLVRQSGRKTEAGIEIDFPITRQDIAEMTGTTLHTVSRLLSAWESDGYIKGGRQKVVVTDPHALMLIAESRRGK